jgi:hypothetical protein
MVALLVIFVGISPRADACKCSGPRSVEEAREQATLVLLGRVISSERHSDPEEARRRSDARDFSYGPWYGQELVIEPLRSWKSVVDKRVSVWTGFGGGDCGLMVAGEGQVYILYVAEIDGRLVTNRCTRSRFAACGAGELEALGKYAWSHPRVPLESLRFDEFAPLPLLDCVTPPILEGGNGWLLGEARSPGETISLEIDRLGRVIDVSEPGLKSRADRAQLKADATRWRFQPARIEGRAVRVRITVEPRRAK